MDIGMSDVITAGAKPPLSSLLENQTTPAATTTAATGVASHFPGSSVKQPPPTPSYDKATSRLIYINDKVANLAFRYLHNTVSTAKYSSASFLPRFLYEQFNKYANLFFLFTAIIQQIPGVSPTSRFTTIIPLTAVLFTSACKEIYEDVKRHKQDRSVNTSFVKVLDTDSATFVRKRWLGLEVGDIVRVEGGESFPADLVLLSSSEPDGLCYVETSNLDGETNLKIRQSKPETSHMVTLLEVTALRGHLIVEAPSNALYSFEGIMQPGVTPAVALTPDQLLLRGSVLRNTRWIYGLVVYTGHDSRLMRNASAAPIKKTRVERMINIQIALLFLVLLALSLFSAVACILDVSRFQDTFAYLDLSGGHTVLDFIYNFLTFIILYNNLIPISLIVTVEIVKFQQAALIDEDIDMYLASTDTPAVARTSNLVEELGQVEVIFSDKTGTLTCNIMELRQIIVDDTLYVSVPQPPSLRLLPNNLRVQMFSDLKKAAENRPAERLVLTLLALCHTVIPEQPESSTDDLIYQASSPDEGALVKGAASLGFKFVQRKPRSVMLLIGEEMLEFDLLQVIEFNSTRKRMSVIVRTPDDRLLLLCKGADNVILERLRSDVSHSPIVERAMDALEAAATEGLRTLCLAFREISQAEYEVWAEQYEKASQVVFQRGEALDRVAELIERNFEFVGATAIEDRLQDGVPETIQVLSQAGIKIWVITGDRQDTAINIGYSARLLMEDTNLLILNASTAEATRQFLEEKLRYLETLGETLVQEVESFALVIDGRTLVYALELSMDKLFLDLALKCRSVLCCRVSPIQKALVVKLVKKYTKGVVLAIGDGANDVSMIQAAHVGVGIQGREGMQAARSADYAIAQFRFLRKLLLVHGAWSYQRLSKLILFSFYKNITLYMAQFWYSIFNLYSGQTMFESWLISLYNVLFTFWPPVLLGLIDQHITARHLDSYPQLYRLGQKGEFLNVRNFWGWTLNAIYHSIILFFMIMLISSNELVLENGIVAGHWFVGTMLYTAILNTVILKAALISNNWTKLTFIAIPGSLLLWYLFLPLYDLIFPFFGVAVEISGITAPLFSSSVFWLSGLILPIVCLYRDLVWKYVKRQYFPRSYHIIQELYKFNIPEFKPHLERFRRAIHKVRMVQRMKKNRGFAFSQGDTGQATLIRKYDTTKQKPSGF